MDIGDLYYIYHDRLYFYILKKIHHPQEAEDLTQDVFVNVLRASIPRNCNMEAWLYTIARHRTIDYVRRGRLIEWKPLSPNLINPSDFTAEVEMRDGIERVQEQMSPDHQAALMQWQYQLSGNRMSAVKMRISRARQQFRTLYQEQETYALCEQ